MPLYQNPSPPSPSRNDSRWPRGVMGSNPNQYWEWVGYSSDYPVRPNPTEPVPFNPSALYIGADGQARYGGNPYADRGKQTAAVWQERSIPSPWRTPYDAQAFQDMRAMEDFRRYYGDTSLAAPPTPPNRLSPYYEDPANLAAAQQRADTFTGRLALQKLANAASIERQKSPRSAGRVVNSIKRRGKK